MDVEDCSESSSEEVEEDKKHKNLEKTPSFDQNKVEIDGGMGRESDGGEEVWEEDGIGTISEPVNFYESHKGKVSDLAASKPVLMKGYGLKKWRRITRDASKVNSSGADLALIHKRRFSLAEPVNSRDESQTKSDAVGEVNAVAEESVASLESINSVIMVGISPHEVASGALGPELELLVNVAGFSVGADSENSDDWSSKSSTAASAPRLRHEAGFGRDRSRAKGGGGGSGHAVHQKDRSARGGLVNASRKIGGEQFSFEKEKSPSSVESGLRSSSTASRMQIGMRSNGKQRDICSNYDWEHSDEGEASVDVRSSPNNDDGRLEDLDANLEEESVKDCQDSQPRFNVDPLGDSVKLLQAVQEALENEIHKFDGITRGPIPTVADSSGQFQEREESSSPDLEAHLIELNQKIKHLEKKLEEASATMKAKESKVFELEAILNGIQFLKEEHKKVEYELEDLLKQKVETEIEYVAITRTTQSWKALAEEQSALFQQQKSLLNDQSQMIFKLRDAENSAMALIEQIGKLEDSCKELHRVQDVLKLQNKVCRHTICSSFQFLLVCIAIVLFLLQLLSPSAVVVPT